VIAKRLVIRGRVQGVGYRESMVDVAQECDVVGWVRNRSDGTVEAWVQGNSDAVERIVAWCRRGPPAARVSGVDVTEASVAPELTEFSRRRTE
jgi:acylphosphatase